MRRAASISCGRSLSTCTSRIAVRTVRSSGPCLRTSSAESAQKSLRFGSAPTTLGRWARAFATQTPPPSPGRGGPSATTQAGAGPAASSGSSYIYEVSEKNFMKEVIEASDKRVVILDCYADWCAPCKQLTPLLEAAVRNAGGKLALAKLNTDQNPNLTRQMQVASLPTVMAVSGRKVVDSFVGLLKPSELAKFLEDLLQAHGGQAEPEAEELDQPNSASLLAEAETALANGDVNQAAAKFSQAMEKDKEVTALTFAGLARCALAEDNLQAAQHLVKELKDKYRDKLNDPAVGKAIAAVELRAELADRSGGGSSGAELDSKIAEWRTQLESNAGDLQTRYDLAQALFATGQTSEALDHIMNLIKRDKHWNDEAARKLMLKIFAALGNNNELTVKARKRFAAIWFC